MTWALLAALLLVFVLVGLRPARRRRGHFGGAGSTPILTLRAGVARTAEKRKRAALDAATGVLR
jgi:hypothetical protein